MVLTSDKTLPDGPTAYFASLGRRRVYGDSKTKTSRGPTIQELDAYLAKTRSRERIESLWGPAIDPRRSLGPRNEAAGLLALRRAFRKTSKDVDKERVQRILTAYIEASIPLQEGVRLQAELAGAKIVEAMSQIPMYTAREIALKVNSTSEKPETLTAQWVSRKRIFGVELAGHGVRYPGFQFQASGAPWPALAAVLPQLLKSFDSLALVLWFNTPHPSLDGQRPLDVMSSKDKLIVAVNETLAPIDVY